VRFEFVNAYIAALLVPIAAIQIALPLAIQIHPVHRSVAGLVKRCPRCISEGNIRAATSICIALSVSSRYVGADIITNERLAFRNACELCKAYRNQLPL
jgi:hypothetical protein